MIRLISQKTTTSEYDQLVSLLSELNDFIAEEDAEASSRYGQPNPDAVIVNRVFETA